MDGRAPRRLVVRLNSGDLPVVYILEVAHGHTLVAGWWVDGCRDDELGLNGIEKLIVEALIYADVR